MAKAPPNMFSMALCGSMEQWLVNVSTFVIFLLISLPALSRCSATDSRLTSCLVVLEHEEVIKHIGSSWASSTDPCTMHVCEWHETGFAQVTNITKDCSQFYCDIDSALLPDNRTCCGVCMRTKCRVNDKVYDVGTTWHNTEDCTLLECSQLPNGQPVINAYEKSCTPIPPDCPTHKIIHINCCPFCNDSMLITSTKPRIPKPLDQKPRNNPEESLSPEEDIWTEEFYRQHPCVRECQPNEPPRVCKYNFVVEWYETFSKACYDCPNNVTDCNRPHCIIGDGLPRTITVVNRMMPGPSIEVCQHDHIVVNVKNGLLGESTTIHWHGMHQRHTPYMDGVPHITQCPISPHASFRYSFPADHVGTHFWHSHTGMQRGDGVFGAFVVRQPRAVDPHSDLYDFDLSEHKMIVQDWVHVLGVSLFASHHHSIGDNKGRNILINGRGRYYKAIWDKVKTKMLPKNVKLEDHTSPIKDYIEPTNFEELAENITDKMLFKSNNTEPRSVNFFPFNESDTTENIDGEPYYIENSDLSKIGTPEMTKIHRNKRNTNDYSIPLDKIPYEVFTVQSGYRYRFRIINAEFLNCPIAVSIDNHSLLAISSDGYDFEPVEVGSIVTYAGERFDFVLNANQSNGSYWIRLKGLMDCSEKFTSAFQVAILRYKGVPEDLEPTGKLGWQHKPDGIELNAMNRGSGNVDSLTIAELKGLESYNIVPGIDRDALQPIADYKFFVYYDFYPKNNPVFHPTDYYAFDSILGSTNKLYTPQLNHISLKFPTMALLPQRFELTDDMFCNETSLAAEGIDCRKEFCKCHHMLQVPLNAIVEFIIVDEGFTFDANHPFHLHGNAFRVVALERLGSNVTIEMIKKLDEYNLLKRNLENPPIKDTVTIPDGGYTIIRFEAYNPGFWLFHCHIEFHAEIGMALVLKVGNNNEMLPVPKKFPTCNNYNPDDTSDKETNENISQENDAHTTLSPTTAGEQQKYIHTSIIVFMYTMSLILITIN